MRRNFVQRYCVSRTTSTSVRAIQRLLDGAPKPSELGGPRQSDWRPGGKVDVCREHTKSRCGKMGRWFTVLAGLALTALATGCGGGDFATATAGGRLMCDGRPVANVTVIFEPIASGNSALSGKQALAETDAQGEFQLSTYSTRDGAVVGKHRVRVAAPDRDSYPDFKCDCELNSEADVTQVEVTSNGPNRFELSLAKRTSNRPIRTGGR